YNQNVTMYEVGSGGCKKNGCPNKVIGFSPALCGNAIGDLFRSFGIVVQRLSHVGLYVTRCDCVHVHMKGCPFVCQCFGYLCNTPLARGICGDVDSSCKAYN